MLAVKKMESIIVAQFKCMECSLSDTYENYNVMHRPPTNVQKNSQNAQTILFKDLKSEYNGK